MGLVLHLIDTLSLLFKPMPSPQTVSFLHLPGPEGWECWRPEGRGTWHRVETGAHVTGALLALPVQALESSPFWMPRTMEQRLEDTAALRWESLGLETGEEGRSWVAWQVATPDELQLVGTVALVDDQFEEIWRPHPPEAFEISARCYPLGSDEAAIWRELGRWAVAVQRNGQLLHTALMTSRELDEGAVGEIRDLLGALEVQGLLTPLSGFRVWEESAPAEFIESLGRLLGVTVKTSARPTPHPPHRLTRLDPPSAAAARKRKAASRRQLRWLAASLGICVLFFATWTTWLGMRQSRLDARLQTLQASAPQVVRVQAAQQRWLALQAATDPSTYPVEVFDQIVALLPEEGVRFLGFTMDLETVAISGEATTPLHASKFQADLKVAPALARYRFSAPVPTIREDNRASFRIEGTTHTGGGDAP